MGPTLTPLRISKSCCLSEDSGCDCRSHFTGKGRMEDLLVEDNLNNINSYIHAILKSLACKMEEVLNTFTFKPSNHCRKDK
jgi:chemotaxis methyl-accepting protein methylase